MLIVREECQGMDVYQQGARMNAGCNTTIGPAVGPPGLGKR